MAWGKGFIIGGLLALLAGWAVAEHIRSHTDGQGTIHITNIGPSGSGNPARPEKPVEAAPRPGLPPEHFSPRPALPGSQGPPGEPNRPPGPEQRPEGVTHLRRETPAGGSVTRFRDDRGIWQITNLPRGGEQSLEMAAATPGPAAPGCLAAPEAALPALAVLAGAGTGGSRIETGTGDQERDQHPAGIPGPIPPVPKDADPPVAVWVDQGGRYLVTNVAPPHVCEEGKGDGLPAAGWAPALSAVLARIYPGLGPWPVMSQASRKGTADFLPGAIYPHLMPGLRRFWPHPALTGTAVDAGLPWPGPGPWPSPAVLRLPPEPDLIPDEMGLPRDLREFLASQPLGHPQRPEMMGAGEAMPSAVGAIRRFRDEQGVWRIFNVLPGDRESSPQSMAPSALEGIPPGSRPAPPMPGSVGRYPEALLARLDPRWDPIILEAAHGYRLPVSLILALIKVESNFVPGAVSPKGALGLMQLMPETAAFLGVKDPLCPRQNILGGCRYLRFLLNLFNDSLPLALAAYNAGYQRVLASGGRIPAIKETQEFVTQVLSLHYLSTRGTGRSQDS